MAAPSRYIQLFHNYDKVFVDQMRKLLFITVDEGRVASRKPIPCVFATPERAFAQMAKQMKRHNPSLSSIPDNELIKNIPLPIASVSRLPGNIDQNRYIRYYYKRLRYNDDGTKYMGTQRPLPWKFSYQIDTWAREIQTLDDLQTQMMLWLRSTEFWMTVDHPIPIGDVRCLVEFTGMVDNSRLESDTEQRSLRRSYTFVVCGWLCYDPIEYGIVEKILLDYYEYDDENPDGTFMERDTVTEESS